MYADGYIDIVQKTIQRAWEEQKKVIAAVAQAICSTLKAGHSVYIFGMLLITESAKSTLYGMNELEMASRFSLKNIVQMCIRDRICTMG